MPRIQSQNNFHGKTQLTHNHMIGMNGDSSRKVWEVATHDELQMKHRNLMLNEITNIGSRLPISLDKMKTAWEN